MHLKTMFEEHDGVAHAPKVPQYGNACKQRLESMILTIANLSVKIGLVNIPFTTACARHIHICLNNAAVKFLV